MKVKLLFILVLMLNIATAFALKENKSLVDSTNNNVYGTSVNIDSLPIKVKVFCRSNTEIYKLIDAMIYVESRGNDTIHNKSGNCIGALQETKTLVRDVNRILKLWGVNKTYHYVDRKNRSKSIEMFLIINTYYHKNSSWETIAKSWNQGIGGMFIYKQKAENYWKLVTKRL